MRLKSNKLPIIFIQNLLQINVKIFLIYLERKVFFYLLFNLNNNLNSKVKALLKIKKWDVIVINYFFISYSSG